MSLDPAIPAARRYPARRPLTYLLLYLAASDAVAWWISDPRRAGGPTYRSLRRAGTLFGFHSHPMWLWALLFTLVALGLTAGLVRGSQVLLGRALIASLAVHSAYLMGTGFASFLKPMPGFYMPNVPVPEPAIAPVLSVPFFVGVHVVALYLTGRDA